MAWPKDEYIHCIGFDKKYLPALRLAVDSRLVVWVRSHGFAEAVSSEFRWAGCLWQADEVSEYITGFRLLEGTIDPETLIAAILGAKV